MVPDVDYPKKEDLSDNLLQSGLLLPRLMQIQLCLIYSNPYYPLRRASGDGFQQV